MKRITDHTQIEKAVSKLSLESGFDTTGLQFEIFKYEKGEQMISPLKPLTFFIFVISGTVRVYQIKEDSDFYAVASLNSGRILGSYEFCFPQGDYTLYAEALTNVKCLILPFSQPSRNLKTDNRFLIHLLKNSLIDQAISSEISQRQMNLDEQLLFYIENICENRTLTNVNHAVDSLHCSRRSLQRVLKKLCDENILAHKKRGCYQIKQSN